jgi:hypothetical protein
MLKSLLVASLRSLPHHCCNMWIRVNTYYGQFMSNNHNVDLATKDAILTSGFLQNAVPVVATSVGRSS